MGLYRITKELKAERYGLTSQVGRAAVSIPSKTCPVK
jgi:four helix bundle protein